MNSYAHDTHFLSMFFCNALVSMFDMSVEVLVVGVIYCIGRVVMVSY